MLVGGLLLLGLLVWLFPMKGLPPPIPPDVQGCFRSQGLPNIEIGPEAISVLQSPKLTASYALEYHKGWVYSLDDALRIEPVGSTSELTFKRGSGLFIFLSREGEGTKPEAQFTLYSADGSQAAIYHRIAERCALAR